MLFFPFYGMLLSILFDILDWFILSFGRLKREQYDNIDKPLDYLQYSVLIPILINTPILFPYLLLLLYRTIGYYIVKKFNNEKLYIFFPNLAEYIALLYFFNIEFNLNIEIFSTQIILSLIAIKLFQEYWIHIKPNSYSWSLGCKFHDYLDSIKAKF